MNTKRKYHCTKMKFSINDFFSKYDQICNAVQCIHFENTTRNSVILPNFLVWKFCGKARFPHRFGRFDYVGNCTFPQSFHTRKLGENTVFFAVEWKSPGESESRTLRKFYFTIIVTILKPWTHGWVRIFCLRIRACVYQGLRIWANLEENKETCGFFYLH